MKASLRTDRIRGGLNSVAAIMPEALHSGKARSGAGGMRSFAAKAFSAKRNGARLDAHRHCGPAGRANARPMTGAAKQSSFVAASWIASSLRSSQ
jgi:hypothetical protein